MIFSSDMVAHRQADGELIKASAGRECVIKALKLTAIIITVGAAAVLIPSRITAPQWQWSIHEITPFAGTLFLAVGVVSIAIYLSGGGRSKAGRKEEIGYDRSARLDL